MTEKQALRLFKFVMAPGFVAILVAVMFWLPTSQPEPPRKLVPLNQIDAGLPRDAADVIDLGNNWWCFTLEVDGTPRRFMLKIHRDFLGSGVAIHELAPLPTK